FFTGGFRIASLASKCTPGTFPMSLLIRTLADEDRKIMLSDPEIWPVLAKSFTEGVTGPSGGQGVMTDAEIYLADPGICPEKITHPIRYWHGGDDKNIPAALVRELTSRMPASSLEVVDDLGHFSLAMHCAAAALDYLAEHGV
ncbi:MAG: hypothetical protein ABJ118_02300, partial [Luteolibacter sp.]